MKIIFLTQWFDPEPGAMRGLPLAKWMMARGHEIKVLTGFPYVYHIADMWPESVVESGMLGHGALRNVAEKALNAWCNMLYRESSVVTVLSPGFKRLLMERGVPAEKIEVVYNWTQEEVFHPVLRDAERARDVGLAGKFNIIYEGNIAAFEGIDVVVRQALQILDF